MIKLSWPSTHLFQGHTHIHTHTHTHTHTQLGAAVRMVTGKSLQREQAGCLGFTQCLLSGGQGNTFEIFN